MSKSFNVAEWQTINDWFETNNNKSVYGFPEHRADSVVIASWNIRKFGKLLDDSGQPKRSAGAFDMIVRFFEQCDLIAVQEVQSNTEELFELQRRLNAGQGAGGRDFRVIMSDVTGKAPGYTGMAERFAYIYDASRVQLGHVASDLSLDRTAVLKNIQKAFSRASEGELLPEERDGFFSSVFSWIANIPKLADRSYNTFVQFIRTPHLVEFVIEGDGGRYVLNCVNAHLVSGKNKTERENEFFALLEWLLLDSKTTVAQQGKVTMLLADLNLDFDSNVSKRKRGVDEYVTSINHERNLKAKVNFPFLDGAHFTNARKDKTYDHIAYIADDERWPRGRHNDLAGTLGPDQFDYGMFDFVSLFRDAGPAQLPGGDVDYTKFEHDFSDHMPIWIRMPMPAPDQHMFAVD